MKEQFNEHPMISYTLSICWKIPTFSTNMRLPDQIAAQKQNFLSQNKAY